MTRDDAGGEIRIAAALITRRDGRALLVRKRNSTAFMQPGGKIQAGEEPAAALCRELAEELHFIVHPDGLTYVGRYTAPAANEPGHVVIAEVFRLESEDSAVAYAEIEEIAWVNPADTGDMPLAPLTRDYIMPLLNGAEGNP